jgi:hypothetical protein
MIRNTHTEMTIDIDIFNRQRALIEKMVSDLQQSRTAFAIRSDTNDLSGILTMLDEINDQNGLDDVDGGPDCPGCTSPNTLDECPDCEYSKGPVECPEVVDVVFLREDGELFAVFPGVAGSMDYVNSVGCYALIGQHHHADLAYCIDCEEVTDRTEYTDLATELERIGYVIYVVSKDRMCGDDYIAARRDQVQL